MDNPSTHPQSDSPIRNLADLVVKYDMAQLVEEAQTEHGTVISSRELLDQKSIGGFFNLNLKNNARN